MLRVLSKLLIAAAVVCGPLMAGICAAQNLGYQMAVRQAAYLQGPAAQSASSGEMAEPYFEEGSYSEENEPLVGEFDEVWDDNSCVFPYTAASVEEGAESLLPDGRFNICGPLWYANVSATMMQRSAPTHQGTALPVATLFEQTVVGGQVVTLRPIVMGTSGVDFHFTPGMRVSIGRNLYEDILRRVHSLEFSFVGLNSWATSGVAIGTPGFSTSTFFRASNLFSNFPLAVGGFNNASLMTMSDHSSFNNYELNYRIGQLPRPDRIAQQPDGHWMPIATPTLVHSFLLGFRMLTVNDHFNWFSSGTHPNGSVFEGVYNVKTTNVLAGAQFGGDLTMNHNIWSLGCRGKAGVYGNAARQQSEVTITDPLAGNSAGFGQGSVPTTAFIGDAGVFGTARLFERMHFRAAYDWMWVGGIANAAQQLQYTTNIAPVVRKNGSVLFQGVSLGFDFCW